MDSSQLPPWPADSGPSTRWPIYTRGNVGEIYPNVVLPLEWALGGPGSEAGWRQAATTIGFLTDSDFGDEPWVMIGVFGGYAYFNAAVMRLLGVRTPGLGVEVIDQQFLGKADVAGYRPRPGDRNLTATAKVVTTALRTFAARSVPRVEQLRRRVDAHRRNAPETTAPTEALWAFVQETHDTWSYAIASHVTVTLQATIASGRLTDLCEKHLGDGATALRLTTGLGDVVSAEPARAMWALANETPADRFDQAFSAFLQRYGHRGPNEFSLVGRDWASSPEVAMAAIDTLRGVDARRSPEQQGRQMTRDRQAALEAARSQVGRRAARALSRAVDNTALWSRARERSKNEVIRLNQPNRHALLELMRRAAQAGGVEDRYGPLLLSVDEFSAYLLDPPSLVATIEERRAHWEHLQQLEPPFAFDVTAHRNQPPPLHTWAQRRTAGSVAEAGAILTGQAGAPGVATGRVRVVTDPGDPDALGEGDIMVAPVTDVAWTPLFVAAAGVVVEVGAAMSHSMIVSRDLGIPCVVGVNDATRRLTDGMTVEIDGSTGTVRVLG